MNGRGSTSVGCWLGGGLLAFAVSRLSGSADQALLFVIGAAGLVMSSLACERRIAGLVEAAAAAGSAWAGLLLTEPWLIRQPRFEPLSHLLAAMLTPLMRVDVNSAGELLATSHEGALAFAASAELFGVRPLVSLCVCHVVLLAMRGAARLRTVAIVLGVGLVTSVAHAGVKVLRHLDRDEALVAHWPSPLLAHSWPAESLVSLLLASLLAWSLVVLTSPSGEVLVVEESPASDRKRFLVAVCLATAGVGVITLALTVHLRGPTTQGRVLVDDRTSEIWEPSARRLDFKWFGDMSTYSFTSAVEFLGYYHATTVNVSVRYTDELLEAYDIVVFKTPRHWIDEEEQRALLRFVHGGGALLLIGDHTNLMGMNARLNTLATAAGFAFRYDSVMDAHHGGFTRITAPRWLRHPAMGAARQVEFMTGCSIDVSGGAQPVLIADEQLSVDHDYSRSSFFGTLYSDPIAPSGPLVLAAVGNYGAGRIMGFSDSTIFSSFGIFLWDRDRLLLGMIDYLSSEVGGWSTRGAWLLVGAALLLAAWRQGRAAHAGRFALSASIGCATWLGIPAGLEAARAVDGCLFRPASQVRSVPRLALLASDCEASFPPVIGGSSHNNPAWSYDTLITAIPRSGVFPRTVSTLAELEAKECLLVLNPRRGVEGSRNQAWYSEWVARGGDLILAVRSDHYHVDAVNSYLWPFGMRVSGHESAEGAASATSQPLRVEGASEHRHLPDGSTLWHGHGEVGGTVALHLRSEIWSREFLGHAFDVPGRARRERYAAWAECLASIPGLVPESRRTYSILDGSAEDPSAP